MKLVEILANELSEWPCDGPATQDPDKEIRFDRPGFDFFANSLADDAGADIGEGVEVTREMWQAERNRQKGGEWKRHRGGKIPVDAKAVVEVKLRDSTIETHRAECFEWQHDKTPDDIMQYRIISQPQAEEPAVNVFVGKDASVEYAFGEPGGDMSKLDWKPLGNAVIGNIEFDSVKAEEAEVREFMGVTEGTFVRGPISLNDEIIYPADAQWSQSIGPLAWRDTIIHCQAIIEDCEREIERNVELLDAEGLMMQVDSKKAMQAYDVDMSDWRNWKAGDIVECTHSGFDKVYTEGKSYCVDHVTNEYAKVADDCGENSFCHINNDEDVKFRLVR